MKLLLDEHFPPALALQLQQRGHDVVAAKERRELWGISDPELLAVARAEGRVLVTENVRDFLPLHLESAQTAAGHPGLLLTSDPRFPRGRAATVGALVHAIDSWVTANPSRSPGFVEWLQSSSA